VRYDDVNSDFAEGFAANQDLAAWAQEARLLVACSYRTSPLTVVSMTTSGMPLGLD